jgi:hypothetical protein
MTLRPSAFIFGASIIGIISIIMMAIFPILYWLILAICIVVLFFWGWYCVTRPEEDEAKGGQE